MRKKAISFILILLAASLAVPLGLSAATTAPAALNDSYTVNENGILDISAPGVLSNDTATGKTLTAGLVDNVKNGILILNSNGSFIYVPDNNFHGIDTFRYVANNGTLSNAATVTITVKAINHAPVARNDSYQVEENSTLKVTGHGILANDTASDGNSLSAVLVTHALNGALKLNHNGSFVYTPNSNFHGMDSFTYKANDSITDSNVATVTITVNPINSPTVNNNPILQLIQQIQSLFERISGMEKQVEDLKAKNDALESRVHQLEITLQNSSAHGTSDAAQTNIGQGSSGEDDKEGNNGDHNQNDKQGQSQDHQDNQGD